MTAAARWPPRNEPANNQFLRLCKCSHNRSNWLFSTSVRGPTAGANLYSLIEAAKGNGIEPMLYLNFVFERLPAAETVEDFEALLPENFNHAVL